MIVSVLMSMVTATEHGTDDNLVNAVRTGKVAPRVTMFTL